MLDRAGVAVRRRFGDYDAARSRRASPRTILVGQRRMTLRFVADAARRARHRAPTARPGSLDPALAARVPATPARRKRRWPGSSEPGALAITTGQQPGLFTGPLYTDPQGALHRGAGARAGATVGAPGGPGLLGRRRTTTTSPRPVRRRGSPPTAAWSAALPAAPAAGRPLTPMYREPLGPGLDAALEKLAADLPASEFRDSTLDWLRRHYRSAATVAGAFGGALAELLAPAGIVLSRQHPSRRQARGRAAHRSRARAGGRSSTRIWSGGRRSSAPAARTSGVAARRRRRAGDAGGSAGARSSGRRATAVSSPAGLGSGSRSGRRSGASRRASRPRLSPNVLLRPVIESALLPTVAYVAGPGELRYLCSTPPVYERMGVAAPAALPRWSGVLVEPQGGPGASKSSGSTLEDLLAARRSAGGTAGAIPAARRRPPQLWSGCARPWRPGYDALAGAPNEIDPTLARPVQGAQAPGAHRDAGHREEAGAASEAAAGDRAGADRPGARRRSCRATSLRSGC